MRSPIDPPATAIDDEASASSLVSSLDIEDQATYDAGSLVENDDAVDTKQQNFEKKQETLDTTNAPSDDESSIAEESSSKQRTRKQRCRKILIIAVVTLVVIMLVLVAVLFIGARVETDRMNRAPDTLSLYTGNDDFCSLSNDGFNDITTFSSEDDAHLNGDIVHCGACGECSTMNDMEIMARTRNTLTDTTTKCAFRTFFGRGPVFNCMKKKVGFTPECTDCWVNNIQCTFSACKFTCIKTKMFGHGNNGHDGELNDCLKCDEVMCGPEFLNCSGANRRRMGIVSDIERDSDNEQCKPVDIDWKTAIPAVGR